MVLFLYIEPAGVVDGDVRYSSWWGVVSGGGEFPRATREAPTEPQKLG